MDDLLRKLRAPFAREAVSWRAQTVTKDGKKALALAYIDSRDVQNRLDDVCGLGGWQDTYPHAATKTICSIGIKIDDAWLWKSDGAGDTDIEAEKGAISDAFKRAAVKWGIGRYLYEMEAVWVPCECREYNGKQQFVKFTDDPWKYLKQPNIDKSVYGTYSAAKEKCDAIILDIQNTKEHGQLEAVWKDNLSHIKVIKLSDEDIYNNLIRIKDKQKQVISDHQAQLASFSQGFNEVRV